MASPQNEVPSPEKHLQFDPLVPSQTNGNSIQGEGHKSQLRIPVPAANFRRLVEQNDCHSFITTDPKYLVGMFDEKRRTIAQEFLARTGSPSYWVCNIKQAYTTLQYSTNLRYVEHNVAAGTYSVVWSFAYIYRSGQWTSLHHKEFVLIAGKPVNERKFMGRTHDPDQSHLGNINMVIYEEGRATTRFNIPVEGSAEWRFPVKEGYLGQSFKVVAKGLEVFEKGSVAFFIRKVGGKEGDGQVYFLGCELVLTKGGGKEDAVDENDGGPTTELQQNLDKRIAKYQADLSSKTEAAQLSVRRLLGKAYFDRYRASGDDYFSCCESSITQYQAAIEQYEKDPRLPTDSSASKDHIACLSELGDVFTERLFRRRFDRYESARSAEECFRSALKLQPSNFTAVAKLVLILNALYEHTRSQSLLDEALQLGEEGLVQATEDDESFQLLLEASATTLLNRSELLGSADELDTAIEILRVGLELPKPVKKLWSLQQLLAELLRRRFEAIGNRNDIIAAKNSIEAARSAENLLSREKLKCCRTHAKVLYTQYLFDREPEILHRVRSVYHEGITLWPTSQDSPEFADILIGLGYAARETYWKAGADSDVTGYSIVQSGCVHGASSMPNPSIEPLMINYMFEYGRAEARRYWLDKAKKEIDNAYTHLKDCLEVSFTYADSFFSSHACTMSWVLRERYLLTKKEEHLKEARQYVSKAFIRPWPVTADAKAQLVAELSQHSWILFKKTGQILHLEQTVNMRRKAVEFASTDFARHVQHIVDLAHALLEKAIRTQRLEDFTTANNELDLARKLVDEKKERGWAIREVRARLREEQYNCSKDRIYLDKAIQLYIQIYTISYSRPQQKIWAAVQAAMLRCSKNNKKGAAESMKAAEKIFIDFVVSDGYYRSEQLRIIRRWSKLPTSAAVFRLLAGDSVGDVVQSLENGRSIIWNRVLNRRAETDLLKEKHPKFYGKFSQLQLLLSPDDSKEREKAVEESNLLTDFGLRENREKGRFMLAKQNDEVLELIRRQTGFENFLCPLPDKERFQRLASQGPIVMIIHTSSLCLALIITKTEITTLALPNFGEEECAAQFEKFKHALNIQEQAPQIASPMLDKVLKWMWTAAAEPILEHLSFTNTSTTARLSKGESRPRMWWVSSGWVNVLPIHAAGDHQCALSEEGKKCSVIDRVISSYTPTLSALEYTRRCREKMTSSLTPSSPTEERTALLIAMPETDHAKDLPNTRAEVDEVGRILESHLKLSIFEGKQATKDKTVRALHHCTIAHFACHGQISPANPVRSRLCLQDHRHHPLTVGVLMAMDIENCQLAYLSACESAVNKDMKLKEEGLHLSGALQMAGVPNTVATFWEISDAESVRIAREFYGGLVKRDMLDVGRAAEALHAVTLGVRNGRLKETRWEGRLSALIWGAYVHFGP